ncbi:hypothetical protein Kpol_1006p11 [Vanderwaltozyma polyspora DSM 70294]|uniref:Mitochondrial aspartate-glutamate transporter AGC1 n=1 Tax=Vanderwaltozyma polyspora (strain ATCC 22028 / DSM 70294 / BCRC 21397 / CBS 2163 / NBRC 10782 / NRRL Y-8283 / UCD 57-17) TaxID=436907 RepID=A7TQ47_VANPO|nr:uncharacterized protein Kpol_1006p11 [Vanderwaltozyma polyspora DSM 70294]EDO15615.1 hypothetical protein Kpol_1006p11 [Vanderwaltozyma polyspora DSM 70294]
MEQINSMGTNRVHQVEIFKKFAQVISEEEKNLAPYDKRLIGITSSTTANNELKAEKVGDLILRYDDFLNLITGSQTLYSRITDHSFNLNFVPRDVFGCIFFAIDEGNKGYLTINDWFYFNNLLEFSNYQFILLYEFFKKFDNAKLSNISNEKVKSTTYGNKSLSFDDLLLDLDQFKSTVKLLQQSVSQKEGSDSFIKRNNLYLDWDKFEFLKYYEFITFSNQINSISNKNTDSSLKSYLSLNSLITIMQSDLNYEKLLIGFDKLSNKDPKLCNTWTINKNQMSYLLKLYYSHRISQDVFDSFSLSNTTLIKSDNNSITYNVVKDIFHLFRNFDLLNQALIRYVTINDLSLSDLREYVITKQDFIDLLNDEYNKVNNIGTFSPSQINLLFSIVGNAKIKGKKKLPEQFAHHHTDSLIEDFIQNEYTHGNNIPKIQLEMFNDYYQDMAGPFVNDPDVQRNKKKSIEHSSFFNNLVSFHSAKNNQDKNTRYSNLTIEDFMKIINPNYLNDLVHKMELRRIQENSLYINYYFYPIFDSIYNFALGSIAGCIGATIVYPIDLIKTRMQAQRSVTQYKNYIDCFAKILSREGLKGLYSGIGPQLIGVAPEKAIKLTVNDYMRKNLRDNRSGKLTLPNEIISGASAGACQVVFTNPLEIVKIRLQVKSEYAAENIAKVQQTAFSIVKSLGITGLYKGAVACLLRDVPFSAIYFPTYAHLKRDLFNFDPSDKTKRKSLKTWELLMAGGLAGMPAAFLTTPFDVIKTRLQIDPRKGETKYTGIVHAAQTILKEENFRSFFKGSGARVLRSSPQFGFTLAAYELFKGLFPLSHEDSNKKDQNGTKSEDEIPSITSSFTSFYKSQSSPLNKMSSTYSLQNDFFAPTVDPYSSNYLNYYYKSCEAAKVFIDLDSNFAQFDFSIYSKFYDALDNLSNKKN